MSLPSYLEFSINTYPGPGQTFQSAAPIVKATRYDLLTFLSVVQKLSIDFLPVTYQVALDSIGRGATAEVRQASVYQQTSFAFKCTRQSSVANSEAESFRALIAEVLVLGLPVIRQHPNIVTLEGISWDIVNGGESAIPVFVFEKAPHGNLMSFMGHEIGRRLLFRERVRLCAEIAKAIMEMHANNVIHGDIKPENVLIFMTQFDDDLDDYKAKVADFGYSTYFAEVDELITMPKSPFWCAPEWHHRGFRVSDAMKMDAYSFGMLSLWLLFYNDLASLDQDFREDVGRPAPPERLLLAQGLTMSMVSIGEERRSNLQEFFACTLEPNPVDRKHDFDYLINLLTLPKDNSSAFGDYASDSDQSIVDLSKPRFSNLELAPRSPYNKFSYSTLHLPSINTWTNDFRIADSMAQLYQFDYQVRFHIAKCFEHRYTREIHSHNNLGLDNIAFQLALCYEVGFGVERDTERSSAILQQTTWCRKGIDDEIHRLKTALGNLSFQSNMFGDLRSRGLITPLGLLRSYHGHHGLEKSEKIYRREIADLELVLGNSCEIVQNLKVELASTLGGRNRWQDAEDLQVEVLEMRKKIRGQTHADTLKSLENLASIYHHQGRWKAAQSHSLQVTYARAETLGTQHPETLKSMNDSILISQNEARLKHAAMSNLRTTKGKEILGNAHPDMLATIPNLPEFSWNEKRRVQTSSLEEFVMPVIAKLFGDDDPFILMSMDTMAQIYIDHLQVGKAENLLNEIIKKRMKTIGDKHPDTMRSVDSLILVLCIKGQWDKAENLGTEATQLKTHILGGQNLDTLMSLATLASIFWSQGQLEKAEILQMQTLETARVALGGSNPFTNMIQCELALTYQSQGHVKKFEDISKLVMETQKRLLRKSEHPDMLMNMRNLSSVYQSRGRWKAMQKFKSEIKAAEVKLVQNQDEEALTLTGINAMASLSQAQGESQIVEDLDRKLRVIRKRVLGDEESDTLTRIKHLAKTYRLHGEWQKAKEVEIKLRLIKRELAGVYPDNFQTDDGRSVPECYRQGRWTEVKQLETKSVVRNKETFGNEHRSTLEAAGDLALTYLVQGRWQKAERLQRKIVDKYRRSIGEDKYITLKSIDDLSSTYRNYGRQDDAEQLEAQITKIRERREDDFPEALTSIGNLTLKCRNPNRWKGLEALQVQIMKLNQRRLGLEHMYTRQSMGNLALTYWNQGRWIEAEELQIQIVARSRRNLGDKHPDTWTAIENLARTYWHQGRWTQTEELELQIVNIKEEVLGGEHLDTINSKRNLATTYRNQGQWTKAIELQLHVLKAYERTLGSSDFETIRSMIDLASMYWGQNQREEVVPLQIQVQKVRKSGPKSHDAATLRIMDDLVLIYLRLGQMKEAEELTAQILETKVKVLGNEHPDTMLSQSHLSSIYRAQQRWEEAKHLYLQIMETQKRTLGEEDPDTLATARNLALLYQDQGLWQEAEELQIHGFNICEQELGDEHPLSMKLKLDMILTHRFLGHWEKAERLSREYQETKTNVSRAHDPDTLAKVAGLALIYWSTGNWEDANDLGIRVMEMNEQSPRVEIQDMADLASTYWREDRCRAAEQVLRQVIERKQKILGNNHSEILGNMRNLISTYRVLGRLKEAEEYAIRVIEMGRKLGGEFYPGIVTDLEILALIYLDRQRMTICEEIFLQIRKVQEAILGNGLCGTVIIMNDVAGTRQFEDRWKCARDEDRLGWFMK